MACALASFLVSAILTIGAVGCAYFTNSISDHELTDVDVGIIRGMEHGHIGSAAKSLKSCLRSWSRAYNRLTGKAPINGTIQAPMSKTLRCEAYSGFILTLSDQQLVTGLAVLVAAISNRCSVSQYEFNIVVSLAWFSTTTHLASLKALKGYFHENRQVAWWRIWGMFATLGMLIFGLVITSFLTPQITDPLQCALRLRAHRDPNPFDVFSVVIAVLYISALFVDGIWEIQRYNTSSDRRLSVSATDIELSSCSMSRKLNPNTTNVAAVRRSSEDSLIITVLGKGRLQFQSLMERIYVQLRFRGNLDSQVSFSRKLRFRKTQDFIVGQAEVSATLQLRTQGRSIFSRRMRLLLFWLSNYHNSFASSFEPMLFSLSYGISQIVVARSALPNTYKLSSSSLQMDYGQIVPLLLLALPILAAGEIYYRMQSPIMFFLLKHTLSHVGNVLMQSTESQREQAKMLSAPARRSDAPVTPSTIEDDAEEQLELRRLRLVLDSGGDMQDYFRLLSNEELASLGWAYKSARSITMNELYNNEEGARWVWFLLTGIWINVCVWGTLMNLNNIIGLVASLLFAASQVYFIVHRLIIEARRLYRAHQLWNDSRQIKEDEQTRSQP